MVMREELTKLQEDPSQEEFEVEIYDLLQHVKRTLQAVQWSGWEQAIAPPKPTPAQMFAELASPEALKKNRALKSAIKRSAKKKKAIVGGSKLSASGRRKKQFHTATQLLDRPTTLRLSRKRKNSKAALRKGLFASAASPHANKRRSRSQSFTPQPSPSQSRTSSALASFSNITPNARNAISRVPSRPTKSQISGVHKSAKRVAKGISQAATRPSSSSSSSGSGKAEGGVFEFDPFAF